MLRHIEFLAGVQSYVRSNPDVAAHVSDHVAAGLNQALQESQARAADMETLVMVLACGRYSRRDRDKLMAAKLKQWKDRSAMRWDSLIETLEKAEGALSVADPEKGSEG